MTCLKIPEHLIVNDLIIPGQGITVNSLELVKITIDKCGFLIRIRKELSPGYIARINAIVLGMFEQDDCIHLEARYGLDINYEYLTDCMISMDISPKDHLRLS